MSIVQIYEARAIFILFFNYQDTESESREIEISVYGPIFTQKKPKSIWDNDIYSTQDRRKMLWQLFIFMEVEPFLYYFMITKTLNTSHEKNKMMRLDQYPHVMRPKY